MPLTCTLLAIFVLQGTHLARGAELLVRQGMEVSCSGLVQLGPTQFAAAGLAGLNAMPVLVPIAPAGSAL